jgi:hypothetical protein
LREGNCDVSTSDELFNELYVFVRIFSNSLNANKILTNSPSASWIRAAVKFPTETAAKPGSLLSTFNIQRPLFTDLTLMYSLVDE